jgi:hypothetical protein
LVENWRNFLPSKVTSSEIKLKKIYILDIKNSAKIVGKCNVDGKSYGENCEKTKNGEDGMEENEKDVDVGKAIPTVGPRLSKPIPFFND